MDFWSKVLPKKTEEAICMKMSGANVEGFSIATRARCCKKPTFRILLFWNGSLVIAASKPLGIKDSSLRSG